MALGPGKYDAQCTALRESTEATVAIAIIMDGNHGSGFSMQATYKVHPLLVADALTDVAAQIRASYKS